MFSLRFARLRKNYYYQFSQNCRKGGWEVWVCFMGEGGAKPSGRGHDNMNAYYPNFLQNFLNSCYYFIIIIIEIVHVA